MKGKMFFDKMPFLRNKTIRILRNVLVWMLVGIGFVAPFIHVELSPIYFNLIIALLLFKGLMLAFFNFLTFSTKWEAFAFVSVFLSAAFYLDLHAIIPLAWLILLFLWGTTSIRNTFPTLIGYSSSYYAYFERYLWGLSLIVLGIYFYFQPISWEHLSFVPFFILSTHYTWGIRTAEIRAYAITTKNYAIEPGVPAVDFTLPDQNGNPVTLSSFFGKTDVLLLFVRGDWCPSCHIMLRTYYKYREKFKEKGIYFIGIGPDPQGVNREMLERLGVDFTLLSDEDLRVTGRYGVQAGEEAPFGDYPNGIPLPAAFIVDKKGIIRYTTRPESPGTFLRPDSILNVLDGLHSQEQNFESFEATYETIVSQANEGILVLDIIEGKIIQTNEYLTQLLGYDRQTFLQKKIFDFCPAEFLDQSAILIAEAWEKQGSIFRMQMVSVSGEVIPTECSAKVIPFGKHSALVLYVRDIRERIRMENQIISQSRIIEQKNKDILDSIEYAKRIQTATLPDLATWKSFTRDIFIYFKPRDIVSGDFYWLNFDEESDRIFFALGDCTGHGVPGAFMSMLAINLLNHLIDDQHIKDPLLIIQELDKNIQKALKQEESGGNDGLDCALFVWNRKNRNLEYMLAGRPLWYLTPDNTELLEVKADKFPLGGTLYQQKDFHKHCIENLPINSKLFLFSDGVPDQIGEKPLRKFGTKKLRTFIREYANKSFDDFAALFSNEIETWKGSYPQLDDMSFLAIQL